MRIVYWRDIPAQVVVKTGRKSARRELPARFIEAIDMCAMRSGATGTDDYLSEWRRGEPIKVDNDLDGEADKALARIIAEYGGQRLTRLVQQGGTEE